MKRRTEEMAFGKINLHLDVTGRQENGYHLVNNVMQTISLCDRLVLEETTEERILVQCDREGVPTDERNIAVRAALLFYKHMGVRGGLRIRIDKQIPMAAGMAGGSADGAAVLRGLNHMYGDPFDVATLCQMGAALGADVPFCVVGGTAFADGLGDRLHPFPSLPHCYLVCACEGEGVSTPWAYGLLDQLFDGFTDPVRYTPKSVEPLREACARGDLAAVGQTMYNVFEEPVLSRRPVAARLLALLQSCSPIGVRMSGSGPSVFGIFLEQTEANAAAELLREKGYRAYLCHPTPRILSREKKE